MDCKPTEFSGKDDPIAAMTWLTHTEKKFRTSKCAEKDKVDYATNLLTMAAHYWWEMTSSTLGEELTSMLTWEQFKVKFNEEYCSPTMIRQLEREFSQLIQGMKTVQEYTIEFNDKARFAKHLIDTEERKIDRYKWGLRTEIREFVRESRYTTFRQVVDAAKDRELEIQRQDQEKDTRSEKRRWEGRVEGSSKREETSKKPRFIEFKRNENKWCEKCRRKHVGACESVQSPPKCYKCGKIGHMSRNCTSSVYLCFNCGESGHFAVNCPKPKMDMSKNVGQNNRGEVRG